MSSISVEYKPGREEGSPAGPKAGLELRVFRQYGVLLAKPDEELQVSGEGTAQQT